MPQATATIFQKNSVRDLRAALSALCRLFLDKYEDDEISKQKDLKHVEAFIRRVDRSVSVGGGPDA